MVSSSAFMNPHGYTIVGNRPFWINPARRSTRLLHEPIEDRSLLNELRFFRLSRVWPFGQDPYMVYFKTEEQREIWRSFRQTFILGAASFAMCLDYGNVLSRIREQALRRLYQDLENADEFTFGIVSFVGLTHRNWCMRCFDHANFVVSQYHGHTVRT